MLASKKKKKKKTPLQILTIVMSILMAIITLVGLATPLLSQLMH